MRDLCVSFLFFCSTVYGPGIPCAQENLQNSSDLLLLEELLNVKISTAAKYEQTASEAPASVTIVTSEDLERYGFRTLEEALRSIRGFYTSNDRNYSYLGVRGFGRPTDYNNRILLLLNGHTMNENVYGSAFIGTELGLAMDMIERIEIVRGSGSALYGTNAMFAVINIITKTGKAMDGFNVAVEAGSYGKRRGLASFGKEFSNGPEVIMSGQWADLKGQDLYFPECDDPTTNHGYAENSDWDKYYGLSTTLTYDDLTLQGVMTSREKAIPTGAWETTFNDPSAKTLDERSFLELKYHHAIDADKNIMFRGYFDHYHYAGVYPYDEVKQFDASDGNWLGAELQIRWDLSANNRLITGAESQKHLDASIRLWIVDTTYVDDDFPFHLHSFYVQDEYQVLENLFFTLGFRRDEYSTVGSSTTPRGAMVYNPAQSATLKFLYGEAFRAPNVYEVNYDDRLAGYKANPKLNAETIRTMEIIWEQRFGAALFGVASFYHYQVNNLIGQILDESDSFFQFKNVGEARANGLELELNTRLKTGIDGYVRYGFQKAEDAVSGAKLTNSPSHILQLGLSYPLMKYLRAAVELQYETERLTVQGTKTEPYLLTNLNLSTRSSFNKHLRFSFLVNNLFNVYYQTPGGFEHKQSAITQNGRNFSVRAGYKF